eukprot:5837453-Alexandrium_andersonii.AAC.1
MLVRASQRLFAASAKWRFRPQLTLWSRRSLGRNRHSMHMHHRRGMLWLTVLPLLAVVMPPFA